MRIVILQPSYLPWLGYFDQLYKSDIFVLYDDVQYDKHGWRNRNRIKTPLGPQWLTVPVLTRAQDKPTNREIRIDARQPWARKHLHALQVNYAKAQAFEEVFPRLENLLLRPWTYLVDLNFVALEVLCDLLGLKRELRFSSQMEIPGQKTQRLVSICKRLNADRYLTGDAAKNYLEESQFAANRVMLEYHSYRHPLYHQMHGQFVPYLSVVDLLMNHGRESLSILVDQSSIGVEGVS